MSKNKNAWKSSKNEFWTEDKNAIKPITSEPPIFSQIPKKLPYFAIFPKNKNENCLFIFVVCHIYIQYNKKDKKKSSKTIVYVLFLIFSIAKINWFFCQQDSCMSFVQQDALQMFVAIVCEAPFFPLANGIHFAHLSCLAFATLPSANILKSFAEFI